MNTVSLIEKKLTQFSKRYYTNELIKGVVLFMAIGLLYFLVTLFIEYFLWLSPLYRTILFWTFIIVEVTLLYKFIGIPVFKIVGLKKGLSARQTSKVIGNHFPEVNDKLLNLLQLKSNTEQSELLLASIEQKAKKLTPIPFDIAINFKDNLQYLKYLALPLLIVFILQFTGNQAVITSSYQRVLHHTTAYIPPAPFIFVIKNESLKAHENQSYTLQITTKGTVVPENLKITYNDESYYLKTTNFNQFEYEFTQLQEAVKFQLSANEQHSQTYTLNVIAVPSILNFETYLQYPKHTQKKDELKLNNGSVTVPEGTKITWSLTAKNTDFITYSTKDTLINFTKNANTFSFKKQFFNSEKYQVATANSAVKNYEQLRYSIQTIPDEYPEILLQSKSDSIQPSTVYFLGKISDDYGVTKLQLVYKNRSTNKVFTKQLPSTSANFQQFTFTFPGNLKIDKAGVYEYHFEVFDNDAIHNFKKTNSAVFTYHKLSEDEINDTLIKNQKENISKLNQSLKELAKQENALKDLNTIQKEKNSLSWNDKNKLKQFIKRQQQQEGLMKKFNQDLQRNLDQFNPNKSEEDPYKKDLQDRLKAHEEQIEQNEELLDELKKLQDKLQDEELFSKVEKLSKQTNNQERSLEQILELTKRFYVAKKFEKLADDLAKLAKEQEQLSTKNGNDNSKSKQDSLTKQFNDFKKELDAIQKENQDLKSPMALDNDKETPKEITKQQQQASNNLAKKQQQKAKNNQQKAAKKMQEMSMKMQQSMQSSSSEQMEEDEKMLRQILDNLISYSFDQEALLIAFKSTNNFNTNYAKRLKKQYILKDHFEHIDDSLFALSLRVPKLSEAITTEIGEVYFNINKALERFADQKIYMGIANQQYALTASNKLANLLSDILKNMQDQLNQQNQPGAGQCNKPGGKGEGFQLSDIIKKQGDVNKQMKEGLSGKTGKQSKDGKQGNKSGKNSNGEGESEENGYGLLFEIYKQQQQLRNNLHDLLKKNGLSPSTNSLVKKMEAIENKLLDKGFDPALLDQMNNLTHELLKLDEASFEQGQDSKRNATTNNTSFNNTTKNSLPAIEQYFNEIEILNRHALPLQPIYKAKVKNYFKIAND